MSEEQVLVTARMRVDKLASAMDHFALCGTRNGLADEVDEFNAVSENVVKCQRGELLRRDVACIGQAGGKALSEISMLQRHEHGSQLRRIVRVDVEGKRRQGFFLTLVEQDGSARFEMPGVQLVSLLEGGIIIWVVMV